LENIKLLIDTALNMQDFEYNKMKKKCTWFWDNYCKHDMLYNFLAQKVNEQ
jgi:hypothetical protein